MRYNILCRRVLPDGRGLEECGPNVRFLPRHVGLSNTSVMVADLQSHTNYSFLLEAVNGVSELAKDHTKQYVSLNVTTNQAGMLRRIFHNCSYLLFFTDQSLPTDVPLFRESFENSKDQLLWVDSWCEYLGFLTKTPDDQVITVFIQQICRRINFHSSAVPAEGRLQSFPAFCI